MSTFTIFVCLITPKINTENPNKLENYYTFYCVGDPLLCVSLYLIILFVGSIESLFGKCFLIYFENNIRGRITIEID